MTKKSLVKWVLLAFVATSICWALVREVRKPRAVTAAEAAPVAAQGKEGPGKVIAYYFHGTRRCVTCRKIETYTRDALHVEFDGEIEAGLLEWRPLNVDESANEHFIQDYRLTTRSVVLSVMEHGKEKRWKNLDEVWALVGEQEAFAEYIKQETRELLEGI